MLAIEVRLLTDRYVATHFNERSRPEWPPHPARLFSAMVATWADDDDPDPDTRRALAWFAALGAPTISCSEAVPRTDVTHYVPVNDASVVRDLGRTYGVLRDAETDLATALQDAGGDLDSKAVRRADRVRERAAAKAVSDSQKAAESPGAPTDALSLLPSNRGLQARSYPCVLPDSPMFWFSWPDGQANEQDRRVLDALLARVSRLGHSSSMVACRLVDDPPPPSLRPDPAGLDESLRVGAEGLLDRLEAAFRQHQGRATRALPTRMVRYRRVVDAPADVVRSELSGDWFVLVRHSGPRLPGHRTLPVARAVREALIRQADQPVAEIISGHLPGEPGQPTPPSTGPHLAVLPLPFVGGSYGDGTLMGVALLLPTGVSEDARRAVLRAIGRWREDGFELRLGPLGVMRLRLAELAEPGHSIARRTWDRPSRRWTSVTPIALDRHPGDLWTANPRRRQKANDEAVASIGLACGRVGLPAPRDVAISRDGLLRGVDSIRRFPPLSTRTGPRRCLVHAAVSFEDAIAGPLLLGAGRFLGYGLCLPDSRDGRADD